MEIIEFTPKNKRTAPLGIILCIVTIALSLCVIAHFFDFQLVTDTLDYHQVTALCARASFFDIQEGDILAKLEWDGLQLFHCGGVNKNGDILISEPSIEFKIYLDPEYCYKVIWMWDAR